jgi:hypothetical protein
MHSSGLHHSLWDAVIVGHSHNQHPDGKFKLPEGSRLSQAQSSHPLQSEGLILPKTAANKDCRPSNLRVRHSTYHQIKMR